MKCTAFADKDFRKKLFSLVLPITAQQFILAMVSASDALMLNLISQEKMAAVSLATQITFVENLFLAAMTIGLSTLAAQYWGNKNREAVERIFAYVLKITAGVSTLFFAATLLFPATLMGLLTNEPQLIADGAIYLRLASPSFLFSGISQVYLCILKNSGRAGRSGLIGSVCMIGDMLMNIVLIVGLFGFPRLEIAGAAVSTTIAKMVEVIWCVAETMGKEQVKLRWQYLGRSNKPLRSQFWKYITPVLGNEIVWGLGVTMFSVIIGHLGSDAVAANSIASIVKNLVSCFCLGLASGGGILVGNELGAGELERAKLYGGRLCRMAVGSGVLSGGLLLALSPVILRFADLNQTSTQYLRWMLVVCSYYMIGKAVNSTTIAGIFCAGGDSKFGFFCDTVVMWCITVPLGFLTAFVFDWPVVAVYWLINLDELLKLPAVYKHYKKYKWVKNLTIQEE